MAYQSCLIMRNVTTFICRLNVLLLLLLSLQINTLTIEVVESVDGHDNVIVTPLVLTRHLTRVTIITPWCPVDVNGVCRQSQSTHEVTYAIIIKGCQMNYLV